MGLFGFLTQGGRRVNSIEKAIQEQEYEKANELLEFFEGEVSGNVYNEWKDYRERQAAALRDRLTKEEGICDIKKSVEDYKFNLAQEKLTDLKSQRLLSKEEITDLDALLYTISEEGLLAALKNCKLDDRRVWSEKFVELYAGSKERTRVVEDLVVREFSNLFNMVKGSISYTDLSGLLHNLNRTLEKYSSEGISLGGIVPIEDVVEQVNTCVGSMNAKRRDDNNLNLGDNVMYCHVSDTWTSGYSSDRAKNIPLESIGRVKKINGNEVMVEFSGKNFNWSTRWNGGGFAVSSDAAHFRKSELVPLETVNQIDKNHLAKMLERTEELFKDNYSNTNTSSKRSNINQLESQDFK
ncbi:hypothetical protein HZA97_08240 [Candidatus Woesearchaeota archaeon]|nr:hypothetical protein [Candidatus Woesearchaeota archaeon]